MADTLTHGDGSTADTSEHAQVGYKSTQKETCTRSGSISLICLFPPKHLRIPQGEKKEKLCIIKTIMSFNQVENHFKPFLRFIDCEVVLNICVSCSIVQISRLYLERQAGPWRGPQRHFHRRRAKQSPSPCWLSNERLRRGFMSEGWLHIVSEPKKITVSINL